MGASPSFLCGLAPVASKDELEQSSFALLEPFFPAPRGVRLLGVTLSALGTEDVGQVPQLSLDL